MNDEITINTEGGGANITGSTIGGQGNVISGNRYIISDNLKNDSTLSPDNLQQLLEELSIAVANMNELLSDEERKRVNRALETLTDEALSEKPEKKWWSVGVDGLTKAAENVGKVGKPVLEIIAHLVPILSYKSR